MTKAKGDHVLRRNAYSAVWVHKDGPAPDGHVADEHYVGAREWVCYDCDKKVVLFDSGVVAHKVTQPER